MTTGIDSNRILMVVGAQMNFFISDISIQKEEVEYLCSSSRTSSIKVTNVCSEDVIDHHEICGNADDKNAIISKKIDMFSNEAGCSAVLAECDTCQNDSGASFSPKSESCRTSVSNGGDTVILDNALNEASSVGQEKGKCFSGMLNWIMRVAEDPLNLSIGLLPEMSKWKLYGEGELWKQILSAREVLFSAKPVNNFERNMCQKKCKMHPSMYSNYSVNRINGKSRYSERLLCAKKSRSHIGCEKDAISRVEQAQTNNVSNKPSKSQDSVFLTTLFGSSNTRKRVRVGNFFQAKVPRWTEIDAESDSRWLGNPTWPIDGLENRPGVDIGKGMEHTCGCSNPNSYECVQSHVTERRKKLKLELGSAFYEWSFDTMGSDVSMSWADEDQEKFEKIVRSNPPSEGKCFWDEICVSFPGKCKRELVRYYYNVFLLHERSKQNQNTLHEIDSDDDCESCFAAIPNGNGR